MTSPTPKDAEITPSKRRWAFVRLALGQAQMAGAVAGIYFLVTTGASAGTMWTVVVTTLFSGLSIWLFKVKKKGS